ncbi:uncharacterized protein LOC111867294 [Cryptotermes secundus]|uniref:uncharacterized protein LOC111867294 n=1 Tax=Cryptotermes secundus TaxID=105785 RepID=UPI000CD7BE28|nr:uncharacterized protein LOC111867294 [Cryptotermes secundus]
MKLSVVFFIGAACVLLLLQCATSQLCPQCICRSSYSPVCAVNTVTGKLRGFSSQCVLNCTNKCRDNRFEYLGLGRCGRYTPRTTKPPAATTTTASTAATTATRKTVVTTPLPYHTYYEP